MAIFYWRRIRTNTFTVIQFGASVGFRFYTVCGDVDYIVTSQHRIIGTLRVLEIWSDWQTDTHLTLTQTAMPLHLISSDNWRLVNLRVSRILSETFGLSVICDIYDTLVVVCDQSQNDKSCSWLQSNFQAVVKIITILSGCRLFL